jgi:hypothetical protein
MAWTKTPNLLLWNKRKLTTRMPLNNFKFSHVLQSGLILGVFSFTSIIFWTSSMKDSIVFFIVNLQVFGHFLNYRLWDNPLSFCIIMLSNEATTTF